MKIVVFGAGSLGLLFGWYLSATNECVCVSRERFAKIISYKGLGLVKDGFKQVKYIKITSNPKEVNFCPELVILATKSYDSRRAIEQISGLWKNASLMTIQNGIYTEEVAKEFFDKSKIFPASVFIGSKFLDNSTIEHFLDNGMKLGSLAETDELEKIFMVLKKSKINVELSDNIMRDKWSKFMFYCSSAVLNALTATRDLSYDYTKWIVKEALDEIVKVSKNLKLKFDAGEVAKEVFEFSQRFRPQQWNASVGEDLKKGRNTEIDYLNGYVVGLAKEFGIDVPVNKTLYSLVKTLEKTGLFKNL